MTDIVKHVDTPLNEIDELYDRLSATFASHKTHALAFRLYNLKQLAYMLQDNVPAFQAALAADLQKKPFDVELTEVWPAIGDIDLAIKRLPEWMADESKSKDATGSFKLARPRVVKQPKGVSLIIGAWNFPVLLVVCPLIAAISAGCPAIIKGSEHSPASSALLAQLIPKYLDPDAYGFVMGGPEQATALLQKRWGHILYTGSGQVGKIVATAAAQTLTSTTLELGGKSPVIVSADADITITARRMLSMKQLNAGQVCVAPDYVLCAKERVDELVKAMKDTLDEFYPPNSDRSLIGDSFDFASGIRNSRDYERLVKVIEAVDEEGKLVYRGETDPSRLRMGINLVRLNHNGDGETTTLVTEETFGPIIPIIPVDDVDAAIRYVNARPTPLALYVCSSSRKVFLDVINKTISGSAIWNDFSMTPLATTLPFGGVGESGWGSYHGFYGFLAFSHQKAVIEMPLWLEMAQKARYAPNFNKKMVRRFLGANVKFPRPISVEHEQRSLDRSRARRHLYIGVLLVAIGAWLGFGGRKITSIFAALRAKIGV
ncbi:hypothetical protein CcaverHIS002_0306000 [Cutaneotrichosporon cavernicola]|uniref:Aldehyde dehydrogenase n=1 Tax=Cutaneotrichosporon cavernicola TaxID=279322 RepID=A0AA48IBC4_9TREE|nr:uncharacterized protein CcaverHIS019_0305950 [Cutaneotrichosporon cavernicola]BEI82732.1 hypothetical protein CcaverHIS002_0306000 [Cutaneotrichosporon cavernicola]BEI90525.1 hypothetical protein CcaverHIS019_0305950 [Cutaneotrichosporon cavernicola]BEI98299.1 hypothetical protein CcaverHIS631_0305980 [Cutaneotrichosporon cavernicola]BEJ06074.1 hypothetical protein CcaverHIS641_0305960 [Cutaneotrichosporon cavernicola]